ncbi:hypothetical protein ACJ73_07618, partial [Blastomyces percursus]
VFAAPFSMFPPPERQHRSGGRGRLSKALRIVSGINTPKGPRKERRGERNPIKAILYKNLSNRIGQMLPTTRSGLKATGRTAQVGIGTESEANAGGIFRIVGSKKAMGRRRREGCKKLFSGDYEGRGQGTDFWREQLGWEGEKALRAIYYRYEAVGNPERKEDNSGNRFSWDVETGRWTHKSEWLKMKRHPGSDSSKGEVKPTASDRITGGIPITAGEGLRDSHDIQGLLPMESGDSTAGSDSGSPKHLS